MERIKQMEIISTDGKASTFNEKTYKNIELVKRLSICLSIYLSIYLFSQAFTIHRTAGNGAKYVSLPPLYHFHPFYRHLTLAR